LLVKNVFFTWSSFIHKRETLAIVTAS